MQGCGEMAACAQIVNFAKSRANSGMENVPRPIADEVGGSCSTGIECAKVQLSSTARIGATQ